MKAFAILLVTISTFAPLAAKDTALHYLVRSPKIKSAQTKVVILLHGFGSNEQNLFSFADRFSVNDLIISARAPIEMGSNRFAWYRVDFSTGKPSFDQKEANAALQRLVVFIEQIKLKYSVGTAGIYLCGFSQGAIMSYSVSLIRPDLINGIAAMSGRLLEEIKPQISSTEKLEGLSIFIAHGINDQVLPVEHARQAKTYLTQLNIIPRYFEYDAGHEINKEMLGDLLDWLK